MLTRRVRGRVFLLRPSKRTNQLVGYVLAVMQKKWGIQIHAVIVMSNHWHVVLTDPDGRVVEFQRDCHQFIARALNAQHGEFEAVWASTPGSRVECETPSDMIDKIAYTMGNPVEAGLVRFGHSWPGLRRAWPSKPATFARPKRFFRAREDGGTWPDEATLELSRPPGYEELDDDELATVIARAIETHEQSFRDKYDAEERPFLGRHRVLTQSRHDRPRNREPRFRVSPKVACRDKWRRIERLQRNKQWAHDYGVALDCWRAGEREVVFPAGTYRMRIVHNVRCDELG